METINNQVWVLRNEQGEYFTGCEFSPDFTAALIYSDVLGAVRDRRLYGFSNCSVQALFCFDQKGLDAHDVEVTKSVCKKLCESL